MRSLLRRYYNVFSVQLKWLNNKIIPLKLPSKHFSLKQSRSFHLFTSLLLLDRIQTKRTRISGPGFYLLDQRVRAESAQPVMHPVSWHLSQFCLKGPFQSFWRLFVVFVFSESPCCICEIRNAPHFFAFSLCILYDSRLNHD